MSSGTVLIVDSTGSMATVLDGALRSAGLTPKTVYTCRQAFEFVQKQPPVLIIFDADQNREMPVEHACQLIREVPQCHGTPFLLVTAYANGAEEKVATAGAIGHMLKPVHPELFFEWLGQNRSRLIEPAARPAPPPPPRPSGPAIPPPPPRPPAPPSMHTPPILPPPRPPSTNTPPILPPPRPPSTNTPPIQPPPRPPTANTPPIQPPPRPPTATYAPMPIEPGQPSMHTPPIQPPARAPKTSASAPPAFGSAPTRTLSSSKSKPVTIAPELLATTKPDLPPVIDHSLLAVPEEPKNRPTTIDLDLFREEPEESDEDRGLEGPPDPTASAAAPATPPPADEAIAPPATEANHILVIDHDPLIQRTLRNLVPLQIPYDVARSVTEGAAFLKGERPVAVFIEQSLPDMAGSEACRFLKALPKFQDLPIFLMSDEDDASVLPLVADCNANGHLRKPFTAETLHAFLRYNKVIRQGPASTPAPQAPASAPPPAAAPTPPPAAPVPLPAAAPTPPPAAPVPPPVAAPVPPPVTIPNSPPAAVPAPPRSSPITPPIRPPVDVPAASLDSDLPDDLELALELPSPDLDLPDLPELDVAPPPLEAIALDPFIAETSPQTPLTDEERRVQACLDIGRKKKREALPMLVQLVEEGSSVLVEHACWSLGELGDPAAVDALCSAVLTLPTPTKVAALEALGKIKAFSAVPRLIEFIGEADNKTKMALVDCFVAIGGPAIKKGLSILSRDFNSTVSGYAHDALVALKR